jgi:hypothetical protein
MSLSATSDDQFKFRKKFKYKLYTLSKETTQSVMVKLQHTIETMDTCNTKSFEGGFERVLVDETDETLDNFIWAGITYQKYIANFTFTSTLMDCNNKEKVVLSFESKTLTLDPIDGHISVEILVPNDFQLVISDY